MKLQTVDDALSVLEALAERGRISVAEVAREYGRSRSSAYRLVKTLRDRQWLTAAKDGTYGVGPLALMLGLRAGQHPILEIASPWLRRLSDEFNETATLSLLVADARMCIQQVESRREIRMIVEVGQPQPLYAGASGRAILSRMTGEDLQAYLAGRRLDPLTPATITRASELMARVTQDRELGYSVAIGERDPDAFSVAAAISGPSGVMGAIAICGPASRYPAGDTRQLGAAAARAAADITRRLGG